MFVARPQQNLTYAPSCNSAGSRGPQHHVSRQAAKNQRRTQPKPRRPQALQRRRHLLRDLFAAGQVGHRSLISAETSGSGKPAGSCPGSPRLDPTPRCEGVRARLCARLLKRSCTELEAALERRHAGMWPEHVLQGDFHAMEGMRRICESFCLRPELEREVLKATADRAQAILTRRTEARSCDPKRAAHHPVTGQGESAEGEGALDSGSDGSTQTGQSFALPSLSSTAESDQGPARRRADTMSSVSDDASVAGTLDGASSEGASADEGLTIIEEIVRMRALESTSNEDATKLGMAGSSSGGSSSECEADSMPPRRVTWRSRALRVLGLQRLWPSPGVVWADAPTQKEEESEESIVTVTIPSRSDKQEGSDDYDEEVEEHALSSKLVAAVRNAELQVAALRTDQVLRWVDDSPDAATSATATLSRSSSGGSSVRFARSSEVSFFDAELELAPASLEYQRSLETKAFDGPSGHKAKRTPSSEKKASSFVDKDEGALSTEDDEEDEWEDHCDDIAELMSQQRSNLLWSQSW